MQTYTLFLKYEHKSEEKWLPKPRGHGFLATRPSNTFSLAFQKVLEGLVKKSHLSDSEKDRK